MKRFLSFAVLAVMYFPGCATSKNAVRCLSRWLICFILYWFRYTDCSLFFILLLYFLSDQISSASIYYRMKRIN